MLIHPWALVGGVLAAGLPIAVHLLTRPRPAPYPLSTLRFIQEIVQQRRSRSRLRDALVLSLRAAALLLLGAAIARPLFGHLAAIAVDDDTRVVRVVILDASQSMNAAARGIGNFEKARSLAARRLEHSPELRANLILAAARPEAVFEQPTTNFATLHQVLQKSGPRPQQINVAAALNLAGEMLGRVESSGSLRRELVVISDFQRSNWATANFSALPADTRIELESVAPDETAPNLALLRVAFTGRPEAGRDAQFEVEVGNFSSTPRSVRVEVNIGAATHHLRGNCSPFARTTLVGDVRLQSAGWQTGEARLIESPDALLEDNTRPFAVHVRTTPHFVLITRQPATQRPSSSYFLERALMPFDDADEASGTRAQRGVDGKPLFTRIDPARLGSDDLAGAELIVLDHVGRLPPELTTQLAGLIRRGRGVLYVASEAADAANLQQLVEAGRGAIQFPVDFVPPPAARVRRDLFLTEMRREQSPFRIFGDELTALTKSLRFSGGVETRPHSGGLADDVLARLNDQSALLAVSASDAGEIIVLNADLGASNLPTSSMFVPLLGELVQRLSARSGAKQEIPSGESFAVTLPSEVDSMRELKILTPQAAVEPPGTLSQESTGVLWSGDSAGEPGAYRINRRDETVFAIAATLPAAECDLRTLSAEVFRDRLSGGRDIQFRTATGGDAEERDTLWNWLAMACIACVVSEIIALKAFRT
jgi:hypothetical protein